MYHGGGNMFQYLLLLETDKEKEFFASIYEL